MKNNDVKFLNKLYQNANMAVSSQCIKVFTMI